MKSSEGDPNKVLIAYSLIYMLRAVGQDSVQLARPHAGVGDRARPVRAEDNANGPKTVKEFIDAAKAASAPFKMGGTGSKREDHVLTVFMEQKTGAKFSLSAVQVRRRGTRPSWSAATPNPTSITPARISRSGAPARSARSARSTRSVSPTRPRSRTRNPGTTSRPARKRGWTCGI